MLTNRKFYVSIKQLVLFMLAHFGIPLDNWVNSNISDDFTNHINFNLYYGKNANDFTIIPYKNGLTFLQYDFFNPNYKTIFYFPGWGEKALRNDLEPSVETLATAFRTLENTNLIVMNYHDLVQRRSWVESMYNSSMIGHALAQYFAQYIPFFQTRKQIHLIGHSLGAPIISNVARNYKSLGYNPLYKLTGLDPAIGYLGSPYYLRKEDGEFVDIVHTADGSGGLSYGYGNVDFFPNGGAVQGYCPHNSGVYLCYHAMSWRYYSESIYRPNAFLGKKCTKNCQQTFPRCFCNVSDIAYLGYYQDEMKSEGYFMKTFNNTPFGMGKEGINFGINV